MPPKKAKGKKAEVKRKEQVIGDKTFGLKNKNKSKNVQKYIQQVHSQVEGSQPKAKTQVSKKKSKEMLAMEMGELFKSAITQPKVPPGVDPKTLLCAFFKSGSCAKGHKCKFSHDLMIGKKASKINLYSDKRDDKQKDLIDDWDQSKLESVITEKHGTATQTDIVCKHFLDAIEKSLYGWFWTCPNGGKACKYRHALPPGYIFQTKAEREMQKKQKVEDRCIEEIIEEQRSKLGATGGTPVTEESFAKWKKDKIARLAREAEVKKKEEAKKNGGRGLNAFSGRALFSYDPSLFKDDEGAADNADDYIVQDYVDENIEKILDKTLYVDENLDGVVG